MPGYTPAEVRRALKRKEEPSYQGTFIGARKYVLQTFATTQSAMMKRRVSQFMLSGRCPVCRGKRLKPEALSVKFAGLDIAELSELPLRGVRELIAPYLEGKSQMPKDHPEKALVVQRILEDLNGRLAVLLDLGLGYLALERSTPTLSPANCSGSGWRHKSGRTCLAWCMFWMSPPLGFIQPTPKLSLRALDRLKAAGNSLSSSNTNWMSSATRTG